jgi:hypothetical protein
MQKSNMYTKTIETAVKKELLNKYTAAFIDYVGLPKIDPSIVSDILKTPDINLTPSQQEILNQFDYADDNGNVVSVMN